MHQIPPRDGALFFPFADRLCPECQRFEPLRVGADEIAGGVVEQLLGGGAGLLQGHLVDVDVLRAAEDGPDGAALGQADGTQSGDRVNGE